MLLLAVLNVYNYSVHTSIDTRRRARRPRSTEDWYEPVVEFAGHILGGTAIFVLIASGAWVLHQVTANIGETSKLVRHGLVAVEYTVFVADALLFLLFVVRTFWRAARKLMRGWNA